MSKKISKPPLKKQSNPTGADKNTDKIQTPNANLARQMTAAFQKLADNMQPPLQLEDLANLTDPTKTISFSNLIDPAKLYGFDQATIEAFAKAQRQNKAAIAKLIQITQPGIKATELARKAVSVPVTPLHTEAKLNPVETVITTPILSALDIGQLVRIRRKRKKLSQQAFADLAGVGRRFISELENGKATLEFDKVLKVAAAAGLDLSARGRG